MTRMTHRKRMRRFGAVDKKTGKPIEVEAGKTMKVPMKYMKTTMMVRVSEGQQINPRKEYLRQQGLTGKALKRIRKRNARARKLEVNK